MNMDSMAMNDDGTMGGMPPTTSQKESMGRMDMDMDMNMGRGMESNKTMTHMTFYWGKNAWILFHGWPGSSTGMYILALVLVFVLALIMECLANSNAATAKSNGILLAIAGHAVGFFVFGVLNKSPEKDSDISSMAC
ncbi:putative Ctr copper transporter [Helianthus annuus]|uniref:Copper transport protein n=1 Tax=Helianthus annuus TaxID=4232 RepID=A0A9K3JUE3_HELAN|nr:putative Ctr copper transporter [Helianthus annuus]